MSFIVFSFARLVVFALIDLPPKVTGDRRASRAKGGSTHDWLLFVYTCH